MQMQRTMGNRATGQMLQRLAQQQNPVANKSKPDISKAPNIIQRMIDQDIPATTDWDELERFVYKTLINPRKQTFEESVTAELTGSDMKLLQGEKKMLPSQVTTTWLWQH